MYPNLALLQAPLCTKIHFAHFILRPKIDLYILFTQCRHYLHTIPLHQVTAGRCFKISLMDYMQNVNNLYLMVVSYLHKQCYLYSFEKL